jgi:two-component system nitrogen regulation response regulator GlnG
MNPPATVLIVDDEPLVRWSVGETLNDSGYRVTSAADAAAAMRALTNADASPDVVLLDLYLPDRSDLGVLSEIRRLSPASAVVLLTAHGTVELFDEARRRGACESVDKPFEMGDLVPLVERALATRR